MNVKTVMVHSFSYLDSASRNIQAPDVLATKYSTEIHIRIPTLTH